MPQQQGRRSEVLAPSDVHRIRTGLRPEVGGRVLSRARERLILADAFGRVPVRLARRPYPAPGDLVIVSGRWSGAELEDAVVLDCHRAPPPDRAGDVRRLLHDGVGARLAQRAQALAAIRSYFAEERFVEVETPIRVPRPGADVHVEAIRAAGGWLITSPEHHMKRLLTGGLPRIFQLARCSRGEELGPWHEPEFLLLEWYRAFSGSEQVMCDTEQIVSRVARDLAGTTHLRLVGGRRVDVTPPYPRITVRAAFRRHAGVDDAVALAERDEDEFFQILVDRVEPALRRRRRPVFLCEYPLRQASLARPCPHDGTVADRFELYLAGVELCNGFGELTDATEQRRRLRADRAQRRRLGRRPYPIDQKLIAALQAGLPPSGGNALGVDRLVALATGATTIAEVQAFPDVEK